MHALWGRQPYLGKCHFNEGTTHPSPQPVFNIKTFSILPFTQYTKSKVVVSICCPLQWLKEISPGCSLEGMMLKLKLQYFGPLMRRVDSLEKTLMLGGIGGRRKREWQRMRWLDGITDSMDMSLSKSRRWWWTEAWRAAIHGVAKSRPWLSDWTEMTVTKKCRVGYNFATEQQSAVTLPPQPQASPPSVGNCSTSFKGGKLMWKKNRHYS